MARAREHSQQQLQPLLWRRIKTLHWVSQQNTGKVTTEVYKPEGRTQNTGTSLLYSRFTPRDPERPPHAQWPRCLVPQARALPTTFGWLLRAQHSVPQPLPPTRAGVGKSLICFSSCLCLTGPTAIPPIKKGVRSKTPLV